MRVLMYYGPEDMKIAQQPEPGPKENQVKLKICYTGICGSDVHGYLGTTGRRTAPMIMGHEFSAEVIEIGREVKKYKPGDRVTVFPVYSCGECDNCKDGAVNVCDNRKFMGTLSDNGAFAEYMCCEEENLYLLPDALDDKTGALIEPFAVAYAAVRKTLPLEGKNVMIIGSGTIGLLILVIAKHFGAKNLIVSDLSDNRLQAAAQFGADLIINSGQEDMDGVLKAHGWRNCIDIVFEAVGTTPTAQSSIEYIRNRGTVIWVGNSARMINIDMQQVVTRELKILGTYIYQKKDYTDSIELLAEKKIDISGFISQIVDMDGAESVFKQLAAGDTTKIKVLVDMRK